MTLLICSVCIVTRCWSIQRRRPGYAPGSAPTFLVRTRKVGKRKRPPVCGPLRCAAGANLRRWAGGVRGGTRCALRAPLRHPPRVRPLSVCILRCSRHPASPAPQAQPQGERWNGPSLRSAPVFLPLPLGEGRGEGAQGRAQRWPECVCHPLWPCREAQGLGRAWAAQHAQASCSDLLRLSERRERSERSEFRSTAPGPSIAGCPQRSEGTRPVGSPFLCLLSFGDAKESRCAAGRTSRPPRFHQALSALTPTLSQREREKRREKNGSNARPPSATSYQSRSTKES